MKRLASVAAVVCFLSVLAFSGDREVEAVVSALEHRYGLHHTSLPWIAKPFIKASGAGMSVETFEDQPLPASVTLQDLEALTLGALGSEWRPFVRVSSRSDGERTLIYAKPQGREMMLLVLTAERDETTVVKMKLDPGKTRDWLDNPEQESSHQSDRSR